MDKTVAIEVRDLRKGYGDKQVLDGISFLLPVRGIFFLRGASGSGKTTLLRILAGLEPADSGTVTGLADKKIAMVFQEQRLLSHFSALDNVAFVSSKTTAQEILCAMELGDVLHKKPAALSGGMQRRVALARALAFGGDILLLDEPFNGLDTPLRERIIPYLHQFAKEGLVLLASHEMPGTLQIDGEITIEMGVEKA